MERIGIMGGSFNPIHTGHLILAQSAWDTFHLSKVLFIPVGEHAFKGASGIATGEERMKMLTLATQQDSRFEVSDIELKRQGVTYTVDTLRELQDQYPEAEFYFITGADIIFELERWKEAATLMKEAVFITAFRPGYSIRLLNKSIEKLKKTYGARIYLFQTPSIDISSTGIRARIRRGQPIRYFVPESVAAYLEQGDLYREEEVHDEVD